MGPPFLEIDGMIRVCFTIDNKSFDPLFKISVKGIKKN